MYRGIFWLIDENLVTVKTACDSKGSPLDNLSEYNAVAAKNYNHKKTWATLPHFITKSHAYNYYPRGRVEIRNEKCRIFLNQHINNEKIICAVKKEFCIDSNLKSIRVISDGSEHYHCYLDDENIS